MKVRTAIFAFVLVDMMLFSGWCVWQDGYFTIFTAPWARPATAQAFVDLCLSLMLASMALRADAERRGLSPWPWLLAVPFLGSIAPLAYFVYRDLAATEVTPTFEKTPKAA